MIQFRRNQANSRLDSLRRPLAIGGVAGGFWLLSYAPAYAYLDPGTGSVLLQVLLGGAAGLAMAGRIYWDKIKRLLGIRPKSEPVRVEPE